MPALAVVDDLDDRRFVKMDREIVDATMYLRALDQELFPDRKLADAVGAMYVGRMLAMTNFAGVN